MKRTSNILLAIDGNYDARTLLAEVIAIARNQGSAVTVLSFSDSPRRSKSDVLSGLQKRESEVRATQLALLSTELTSQGFAVTIEHATGKPHLEIIRRTLCGAFDLVMKPVKREVGLKQFLIGGTDIQLLSLCPVPVWIFQPTTNQDVKGVTVAVDLQPIDLERTALAQSLLSWGKYIADMTAAELHVVHVWDLYRESSLRAASVAPSIIDKLLVDTERLHRRWLDAALMQAGLINAGIHIHLCKGGPKQVIPKLAGDPDVDLLIMGTVGRTDVPGFFIGNTADSVLRKVDCSVLAIKPDNFATPVERNSRQQCSSTSF